MATFRIGDRVLVVGPGNSEPSEWYPEMDAYLGLEGTITSKFDDHWFYISFGEDTEADSFVWHSSWLSLVQNLHVPGAKDNVNKPPVGLLFESFPKALLEVAKVAGYGEKKYTRGGWRKVPNAIQNYTDAAARHELYRFIDGDKDSESNHWHLAHQAWNILAVLEKSLEN